MTLEQSIQRLVADAVRDAIAAELPAQISKATLPVDPDKGYSVDGAAEYLGVTPSCIRERVKAGELEAVRLGKYLVIPHRSIQTLIANELAKARFQRDRAKPAQYDPDDIHDDIGEALGLSASPRTQRVSKEKARH